MKAKVGDWLVMKALTIDQPEQRGLITEVHSDDGSPPYVVHWLDSDHIATVFPGPDAIVVTAASLKANRGKWVRFVKAYLEATHYMTVNKEGSMQVLRRIIPGDEKETLEHAYEEMRARATVDLLPPDAAVENLIKMMTYVDKRSATVDRSRLADYSILKEAAAKK